MTAAGMRPPMNMAGHRHIGDRADDQHGDARRHGLAHDGRGGKHRRAFGGAVASRQFVAHDRADGGDVGGLGAGEAGDDVHADHRDLQQSAAKVADQRVNEADQPHADAAALHDQSGQDEEGNGEKNEVPGARSTMVCGSTTSVAAPLAHI